MSHQVTWMWSRGWGLPKLFVLFFDQTGGEIHFPFLQSSQRLRLETLPLVEQISQLRSVEGWFVSWKMVFYNPVGMNSVLTTACLRVLLLYCSQLIIPFTVCLQLCDCGGAWLKCVGLPVWLHLLPVWKTWSLWCGDFALLCERGHQYIFGWLCSHWESSLQGRVSHV